MSQPETAHLIGHAKRGEQRALNALFERCSPRLLPYVRYRTEGRLRAQLESRDILQNTLQKAFRSFPAFRGTTAAEFLDWLRTIATNTVNDQVAFEQAQCRDVGRRTTIEAASGEHVRMASALTQVILSDKATKARLALDNLLTAFPETDRNIFLARRLEELSWMDIGEAFGASPEACRMRYNRMLKNISPKLVALRDAL